ncbi:MAG: DNA replication and repair protein RecF [Thermomicrobiales bacterium]|nr:DNA replication and repair protein RecF [Thermomicrobiales bacterium]
MQLRALELDEFRSFRSLRLDIDPAGFRAIGANASGKSTLLEAIAMLATTRSPRTSAERELANWESGSAYGLTPYARLRGVFDRIDGRHTIAIGLSVDEGGRTGLKKSVQFDDQPTRAIDAVGQFKTVLFSPDDVELVPGAPGGRRRYLDLVISQARKPYLRGLSRYVRVLEQRNGLLRSLSREGGAAAAHRASHELPFWDEELTSAAAIVLAERLAYVARLGDAARVHFEQLTGVPSLELIYQPHRLPGVELPGASVLGKDDAMLQLQQRLAAQFSRAVGQVRPEEIRRGVTAVGPHRDDLAFRLEGADLGRFGSRGQQRLALVATKLAEVDLLRDVAGEPPVLLLDDVLSELDPRHRRLVVEMIATRPAQVCVTATDIHDLEATGLSHLPVLRVAAGRIESDDEQR